MKLNNISIQKKFGWCTTHCLINMFCDEGFEQFLDDENFKAGGIEIINKMLSTIVPELEVCEIAYVSEQFGRLPKQLIWDIVSVESFDDGIRNKDKMAIPYLVSIDSTKDYRHSVAIINYQGNVIVSNPYHNKMQIVNNSSELNNMLGGVTIIERFKLKDSQKGNQMWAGLWNDNLDYLSRYPV